MARRASRRLRAPECAGAPCDACDLEGVIRQGARRAFAQALIWREDHRHHLGVGREPRQCITVDLTEGFPRSEVPLVKLIFAMLALAMAFVATSVQAQIYDPSYPVCIHVYGVQEGDWIDCSFTSLAQCKASASGRAAMCLINPYFVRPSGRRRR
jgi:hypothetical protein